MFDIILGWLKEEGLKLINADFLYASIPKSYLADFRPA